MNFFQKNVELEWLFDLFNDDAEKSGPPTKPSALADIDLVNLFDESVFHGVPPYHPSYDHYYGKDHPTIVEPSKNSLPELPAAVLQVAESLNSSNSEILNNVTPKQRLMECNQSNLASSSFTCDDLGSDCNVTALPAVGDAPSIW